jgi:hypothetical protein
MSQTPSRSPRKPVQVFAVQAAALGVLLGFLPGMDRIYPMLFNAHAQPVYNAVLAVVAPGHYLRITTIRTADVDRRDTRMVGFGPRSTEREWRQFHRVFTRGWWPTAIVMGMVLATPLPWRRRAVALVAGVLIADALILIRIGVMIFLNYVVSEQGAGWEGVRKVAEESFRSWVPPLVIVLISWVAAARPASTIDLAAARHLLRPRRASAAPAGQGVGEGRAGRVAGEGQQQRERGAEADE